MGACGELGNEWGLEMLFPSPTLLGSGFLFSLFLLLFFMPFPPPSINIS